LAAAVDVECELVALKSIPPAPPPPELFTAPPPPPATTRISATPALVIFKVPDDVNVWNL
jgi:hypothetical protein